MDEVSQKPQKLTIPTIRTFKQDLADAIKHQNLSLAGAALEEARRRAGQEISERHLSRAKIFFLAGSLVALSAGLIALWSFFVLPEEGGAPAVPSERQFVTTDLELELEVNSQSAEAAKTLLASEVRNQTVRIGNLARLKIYQTLIDAEGLPGKAEFSTSQLLKTFGLLPPTGLERFLEEDFLLAIHSFKENSGFLMFKTTSFQSAFAALLEWEKNMALDLYPILSGETLSSQGRLLNFNDEIIKNIDTRVLRDAAGEIILIYSFLNSRDTIFIGTNEFTFAEVLARFQTPRQIVQ